VSTVGETRTKKRQHVSADDDAMMETTRSYWCGGRDTSHCCCCCCYPVTRAARLRGNYTKNVATTCVHLVVKVPYLLFTPYHIM